MQVEQEVLRIKKYPNRRLYSLKDSCYIVLTDLLDVIAKGGEVNVTEAKSDVDITAITLLQAMLLQCEVDLKKNEDVIDMKFLSSSVPAQDDAFNNNDNSKSYDIDKEVANGNKRERVVSKTSIMYTKFLHQFIRFNSSKYTSLLLDYVNLGLAHFEDFLNEWQHIFKQRKGKTAIGIATLSWPRKESLLQDKSLELTREIIALLQKYSDLLIEEEGFGGIDKKMR